MKGRLPQEMVNKILFEFKGCRTPTAELIELAYRAYIGHGHMVWVQPRESTGFPVPLFSPERNRLLSARVHTRSSPAI